MPASTVVATKDEKRNLFTEKTNFVHNGPLNEKVSPISTILIRWESQMIQANFQRKGESKDEKRIVKKGGYPDFFGRKNPHFDNQTHSYFLSLSANEIIISRWCSTCQCHSLMLWWDEHFTKSRRKMAFKFLHHLTLKGRGRASLIFAPQKWHCF